MDVIVTGGLGFIGKNFCNFSSKAFKEKIILDKLTYASDINFYYKQLAPAGWQLIPGDVCDIDRHLKKVECEDALVVNFAAESHVDTSFTNADVFLKANALGTLKVLEFCRCKNYRLLHISTDEVYGETLDNTADEDTRMNPTNPYSATKAAADLLVQTYIKCFQVDAKIIRANNVYGRRQLVEKVIPKAISYAYDEKIFYLHGSKDLKRHFVHCDDFSRALMNITSNWKQTNNRIFNISGDTHISIHDLVKNIYEIVGAPVDLIRFGPDRPFNDCSYFINDQILRSMGWSPEIDFNIELKNICRDKDIFFGIGDV